MNRRQRIQKLIVQLDKFATQLELGDLPSADDEELAQVAVEIRALIHELKSEEATN